MQLKMSSAKYQPFWLIISESSNGYNNQRSFIVSLGTPQIVCVCERCSYNVDTLRPRQDGRHFADDIFTCIFFNENCCILIKFSLKYVRKGPIDNNRALVQIWLGADQATSHYLNQLWLVYRRTYASLGLNELKPSIAGISTSAAIVGTTILAPSHQYSVTATHVKTGYYGCPIFRWVAVTWLKWVGTSFIAPGMTFN